MSDAEKSQKQVAQAIGRTSRQVRNLTDQGVFVRVPSAADPAMLVYPWPETLERWVAYSAQLQTTARAKSAKQDALREAQKRAALAEAETREFRLEQMRGEWVRREAYAGEWRRVLGAIAGVLDLAPGKHGPRLPGDAPIGEKVAAIRAITRELRAEIRRACQAQPAAAVLIDRTDLDRSA